MLAEPGEVEREDREHIEEPEEARQVDDAEPDVDNQPINDDAIVSEEDENEEEESAPELRRSARVSVRPERYQATQTTHTSRVKRHVHFANDDFYEIEQAHSLHARETKDNTLEYEGDEAYVIARMITEINLKATTDGANFAQQYILKCGIDKFGDRGKEAALKELQQLHARSCFTPIDPKTLTPSERKKAQEGLMFITEKRDGTIKGRLVYNGKPTREWISREEAMSPTVSLESTLLTAVINAKEGRDVMTVDIPNAYIQADLPPTPEGGDRVILKLSGMLVDLVTQMAPET